MTQNLQSNTDAKPFALGYRQRAEWERQDAVWLAWPSHDDLWGEHFEGAQQAVCELAKAIHAGGAVVKLLCLDAKRKTEAKKRLEKAHVQLQLFQTAYGDIWLRDTAPLF